PRSRRSRTRRPTTLPGPANAPR
ncbi:MAG: hypothetical protein AVDCRST_MAG10-203, partial [uncultured Acidimicrobiales bacterium]